MPRVCEMCPEAAPIPASVFCPADQCYLCSTCDHVVHTANRLARRHVRRPLTATDSTDGSSINDESDARVPDVATPSVTAPPLLTTSATTKPTPTTPTTTTTTTTTTTATTVTTASTAPPSKTKDDDDVAVTFEDAADYDFCFDAIGPRMPALAADDMDDTLFADGKLARTFYPDMSWESVVPDAFEHVVPDVEAVSASRRDVDDTRSTLPVLFDSRDRDVRARDVKDEVHIDHLPVSEVDMDVAMDVPDLCDDKVPIKLETESDSPVVHPVKEETKKEVHASIKKEDHMDVCSSVCTKLESSLSKSDEDNQADANDDDDGDATQSDDKGKTDGDKAASSSSSAAEEDNALARAAEERKKRRMEALARFRSKRANRSFTKKVRYECRKQLADSRPRVKGRFVRKVEMALFRKYGALYREHLDELKTGADETVA